ncbi:MAG: right-handed parallel beta-helix repeat-containing protein [Flavobacteriales bacterium]|nr:right-handed parallel beta-helix repeat-containing protein [Flavobacteriales bacterium]
MHLRFLQPLAFCALFGGGVQATTYYIAPEGSDSNNGTSPSTPWRSIARLQQAANSLQPGDEVLFQRGGSYPGQLTLNTSGSSSQPIVLGAYGSGPLPEISGASTVTGWTQHQGQIWRANVTQGVKYVRVDGALMTLARYPNTGWLRVNTASTTQVNCASLSQANGHWNGARLVIRNTNWCYENAEVTTFANSTLTFPALHYNPGNHQWGFFLCNKLSELDSPGEWYYDAAAGVLYLWAPNNADPNTLSVRASVHEYGVNTAWQKQYITIQDLAFRDQQHAGIYFNSGSNMTVTGCTFEWTYYGIRSYGSHGTYTGNTLRHTYATSMTISDDYSTVANNVIEDIALIPGLGESFWGYYGLHVSGASNVVRGNRISRTGNSGLFLGGSPLVEKNIISDVLLTVNDGGGIYWDSATGATIQDNIISNVGGNMESVASDFAINTPLGHGIYFGNSVIQNIMVRRNTVSNCSSAGIHVDHTMVSNGIEVRDNVLYGNDIQLSITDQSNVNGPGATPPYYMANFNDAYTGNTLYCTTESQRCMQQYHTHGTSLVDFGTFTNNRLFNPYNELSIRIINSQASYVKFFTLERWSAERNEESGSTRSPFRQNSKEVTQRTSANMAPNGTFDYNTSGWSGWPTEGQISHQTNVLDNGALKVVYGANSGSPEFYLRTTNTMDVVNGSWYELKFSIQSNAHGTVRADVKAGSQAGTPYSIHSRTIPFDTQRRDMTIVFQSNLSEPALFILANHFSESTYWIDNVELYKVNVQTIDPQTRHVLHTNPTGAAVEVPLTGCWRDVSGTLHSGSITLPAFGSTVLALDEESLCGLTTEVEDLPSAPISVIYPNPAQPGTALFLGEAVRTDASMEVLDASGRMIQQGWMRTGESQVPLTEELRSGHYLILLRQAGQVQHHRIVVQ